MRQNTGKSPLNTGQSIRSVLNRDQLRKEPSSDQQSQPELSNPQRLEEADGLKYIWSILKKYGSSIKEIKISVSLVLSALIKLNIICKSCSTSFPINLKL